MERLKIAVFALLSVILSALFNQLVVDLVGLFFSDYRDYFWIQFFAMGFFFVFSIHIFFDLYYVSILRRFSEEVHETNPELPSVSAIIPAYNEENRIAGAIESVLKSDYPNDKLEVIVVDDGSTDNTSGVAARYGVKVIRHSQNMGRGKALETGVRYAQGQIIVFLDADTRVESSALRRLVSVFEKSEVGGACGRLIPVSNRSNILIAGQKVEYALGFAFTKMLRSAMGWLLIPSGAFSAHRRELLLKMKFADTLAEDFDIGLQMIRTNHRLAYVKDAVATTEVPATFPSFLRQRNRWTIGGLQVMAKHARMVLNKRFGIVGLFGLPFHFVIGFAAPVMESFGLLFLALLVLLNPFLRYFGQGSEVIALSLWLVLLKTLSILLVLPGYYFARYINGERISLRDLLTYWFVYYYLLLYTTVRGIINYLTGRKIRW